MTELQATGRPGQRNHNGHRPPGIRRLRVPLKLSAAEAKTSRAYHAAVPPDLTPYIDGWLQVHRLALPINWKDQGAGGQRRGHLWLDGYVVRSAAIRQQIETRTKQASARRSGRTCSGTAL
jgi:hypothetical protein